MKLLKLTASIFIPLLCLSVLTICAASTSIDSPPRPTADGLLTEQDLGSGIGQPGSVHKSLNDLIGRWHMNIMIWNGPRDSGPMRLTGTMERRWVLKGRFIEERVRESAESTLRFREFRGRRPVTVAGHVYEGLGYLGYDRLAEVFEYLWIHDDSTRMYYERGRFVRPDRSIVLTGSWTDPYDASQILSRRIIRFAGPNRHTVVRYISDQDTGEFKDLEIEFTREN